ncbi:MAG: sorbosone dehydrogenase family protein [Gammaproteobacteria bacterium]
MTKSRCLLMLTALLLASCAQQDGRVASAPVNASPGACATPDELNLPPGFCATVFADDIGSARHIAVRDNGDVYVSLRGEKGVVVALRDSTGDGVADETARFGRRGGTGIAVTDGHLYLASPLSIVRYPFDGNALVPLDDEELIVGGFNAQGAHASKTVVFDNKGGLLTNIGVPSNACQKPQRTPGVAGQDPCPELEQHGGVWRFDADRVGQDAYSDGERYATGIRNAIAQDWHPAFGKLYVVQHGRDQLSELWPKTFSQAQRIELPAEEFFDVERGDDFGWPYCYYDPFKRQKLLGPEYGGDGETVGRCAEFKDPLVAFPAHWAPNDLHFYRGRHFPARYRHGAFVAFHGSWNRAPEAQRGYNVAFVPMRNGAVVAPDESGFEVFADGFAHTDYVRSPGDARYRPTGIAESPEGHLYISDSRKGRIWRIEYLTPAEAD